MQIKTRPAILLLSLSLVVSCSLQSQSCFGKGLSKAGTENKSAAKEDNIGEAQKLNGEKQTDGKTAESDGGQSSTGVPTKKESAQQAQSAKDTAKAVNTVPGGAKVTQQDMQTPSQQPIKGFHPIKKLLRPVENLEGMSIKLEQQIMKLEGPIAGLQPPMKNLQGKMTTVDTEIKSMQTKLSSMQTQVDGVRSDLKLMREQIAKLQEPIEGLRKPIATVGKPLEQVQQQLNWVLLAILVAAVAIAVGTPLAAILVYRHRHTLFPGMKEHEMPQVTPGTPPVSSRPY
jgi:chromosome segregation ATPase